jgi:hypothetical protein
MNWLVPAGTFQEGDSRCEDGYFPLRDWRRREMRKNFRGPAEGVMFETLLGLFLEKHALNIDVHCDAIPKDLPKHLAVTLFRVLQEALQNV